VEDFANPAGRADDNDLRTDERGRFYGKGERYQGHTADPSVFPVQHENELFAHAIGQRLDHARNEHRYSQLVLMAAPKFLGLIRKNLNKEIEKMVTQEMPKDISNVSDPALLAYIKEHFLSR
jgi:protein required for attachment to host cells